MVDAQNGRETRNEMRRDKQTHQRSQTKSNEKLRDEPRVICLDKGADGLP